ncbi:MAG: Crp/Fnr family transcriptional regulator [Acidobacteria bacterium]|nr:MAG: Crp/Fnr family transcriptional regulator [Acidobacteriota bacterium]
METAPSPEKRKYENLLLAALPAAERARLDPYLHFENMKSGLSITTPGEPIQNLYFPFDAVTSTVQEMSDGSSIESGLMGLEGLAGVQVWLRQTSTPSKTFVQIPGTGMRISTEDFIREVRDTSSPLNDLIAAYVHAFLVLTSLTAACNRLHTVDERLCRWLAMCYNRAGRREFPLRHEFLAQMLGVHRPTVSVAANMLQKAGLIQYQRGNLRILNPEGLIDGACECYSIMEAQVTSIYRQTRSEKKSPSEFRLRRA